MEIKIYDTNIDLIGIIDTAKAVIWNRKYYTAGEFEVHVPANEIEITLIQKQNIVTKDGSVEFGIIENVTIEKTEEGEFIKASGRFGSSLLARRIVFDTTVLSTTFENAMRTLVYQNAIDISIGDRVIPGLELGTLNGYTNTVSFQVSYRNLLTVLSGLSETSGIGFRVVLDVSTKKFKFETYKAFDRSINQSLNPRAIFSNDYDNLLESMYKTSDIEHSSVALVGGEGEGESRKMVVVGSASGLDRYEVFVNAKSIRMTDGITEPEYYAMLAQKGAESLMPKVEYFEGNVLAEGTLIYKQDYDLGDIITIENTKWGKRINVQITEITEVYDDNGMQITPVFGQATQTLGEVLSGKEDTSGSGSLAVTAHKALVSDANGNVSASSVTDTELGYLSGVLSPIQSQINSKLPISGGNLSGRLGVGKTASTGMIDAAADANGISVNADGKIMSGGIELIKRVDMVVTDFNAIDPSTLIQGRIYTFNTGFQAANRPTSENYHAGFLQVHNISGKNATLVCYSTGYGVYIRYWNGTSWSGWVREWNDATDGAGSGLDADYVDAYQLKGPANSIDSDGILANGSSGIIGDSCAYYKGTTTTVANTTEVQIPVDTLLHNTNTALFTLASGVLTVKKAGLYLIVAYVRSTSGTAGGRLNTAVWKNATAWSPVSGGTQYILGTIGQVASQPTGMMVPIVLQLAANDTLTLSAYTTGAGVTIGSGFVSNLLEVTKLA